MWQVDFVGPDGQQAFHLDVDDDGNVYVAGWFENEIDVGGGARAAMGSHDGYVASLDSSGMLRWWLRFGETADVDAGGTTVAVGSGGTVYIGGFFGGQVRFGSETFDAASGPVTGTNTDTFVLALDPASGEPLWARHLSGTGNIQVSGLAAGESGGVVASGGFEATMTVAGAEVRSVGGKDVFLASFTSGGDLRWVNAYGGSLDDDPGWPATGEGGRVVFTGAFRDSIDLGGGSLSSAGGTDAFVATFDSAGAHQWSASFGGSGDQRGHKSAVDSEGSVYVGGWYQGTVAFAGESRASEGDDDFYVASYAPDGSERWLQGWGSTASDRLLALEVEQDRIFVGGWFDTEVVMGSKTLTSAGAADAFVAELGLSGAVLGALRWGSTGMDATTGLALGRMGSIHACGWIDGEVDIEGTTLGGDGIDAFAVELVP